MAVIVTLVLASNQPSATSTEPLLVVPVSSQYWVFHCQVMVLFWVTVRLAVLVPLPVAGTSPVPVHPVATYWVVPNTAGEPATLATPVVP